MRGSFIFFIQKFPLQLIIFLKNCLRAQPMLKIREIDQIYKNKKNVLFLDLHFPPGNYSESL